ncbi:hypothetical protein ACWIUD_04810 [Helicobacter sp. 23-1044]
MNKINKIAVMFMVFVAVGIGFGGCGKKGESIELQIATARSDSAATLKAIVSKVFADNIDTTKATAPNGESWGEWIMTIAQLDKARWAISSNGVYPIDRKSKTPCHNSSKTPLIWINSQTGSMHFNPSKLTDSENGFCVELKNSYVTDTGNGDRVIPLN